MKLLIEKIKNKFIANNNNATMEPNYTVNVYTSINGDVQKDQTIEIKHFNIFGEAKDFMDSYIKTRECENEIYIEITDNRNHEHWDRLL